MSEEKFDTVIFKGKTFGNLLEEIHSNSRNTDKLLFTMVQDMKDLIEGLGDAIQLAPIIATYVKMAIDNNEHIIKIAGIVQKSLEKSKDSGVVEDAVFTEEDRKQLEEIMNEWEHSLGGLPDVAGNKVLPTVKAGEKLPDVAGKVIIPTGKSEATKKVKKVKAVE